MRDAAGVSAASRWPMSVAQMLKASRGVMGTHQRPRSVDAEAAQSGANGACETGARAELGFKADENEAAVVTENDRLSAVKLGPAAQVSQLVVAEHGECAAERLGRLHGRRFTEDMMSK